MSWPARIGAQAIAALLLAVLVLVAVRSCAAGREDAAQGRQDSRDAAALAATAREAAASVTARADEEASVDELVAAAKEEIDNAPTDEAAGDAARAAICSLPEYRDDPACGL